MSLIHKGFCSLSDVHKTPDNEQVYRSVQDCDFLTRSPLPLSALSQESGMTSGIESGESLIQCHATLSPGSRSCSDYSRSVRRDATSGHTKGVLILHCTARGGSESDDSLVSMHSDGMAWG